MQSIILFASGAGSNVAAITAYFKKKKDARVSLIVTNNPDAGVLNIARKEGIPFLIVDRKTYKETLFTEQLAAIVPDLIVLAGFLWKIPDALVHAYSGKIINIHPSLLPQHGGKGMYGINVQRAALEAGDAESGITIHYVNERYDEGKVIVQVRCPINDGDTPEVLAGRIHRIEHYFFPRTIEFLLEQMKG